MYSKDDPGHVETTAPKPFIFVLMPFSSEFNDVYTMIREACGSVGAYCERVDEQNFDGTILERIYNQIAKADLIVSEMTGRNPNVFYETGYAHALGKRTILLTRTAEDIPFDLKQFPHIVYGTSIVGMRNNLTAKLRWGLKKNTGVFVDYLTALKFFMKSKEVSEGAAIVIDSPGKITSEMLASGNTISTSFSIKIDIHNSTEKVLDDSNAEIALECPRILAETVQGKNIIAKNESRSLIMLGEVGRFAPNAWRSVAFECRIRGLSELRGSVHEMELHVFAESGKRINKFTLSIQ